MNKYSNLPGPIFGKPKYQLSNPRVQLTQSEIELLNITSEDVLHIGSLARDRSVQNASEIRALSTLFRRLFCDGDLHKAAKLAGWHGGFSVKARLLIYPEPHPQWVVSCGNYQWGEAKLPGVNTQFGGKNVAAAPAEWSTKDDVILPLPEFLDSLAFSIAATKVRRRDVITYVANKKAAHISDNRAKPAHKALDALWHGLFVHRVDSEGFRESLNVIYLELLSIITAIGESDSIQRFAENLRQWTSTAELNWGPEIAQAQSMSWPMEPLN